VPTTGGKNSSPRMVGKSRLFADGASQNALVNVSCPVAAPSPLSSRLRS
jgi:hypothetical protein